VLEKNKSHLTNSLETYGPVILLHRARKLRRAHPERGYIAPLELETGNWQDIATRVLTRPVRMFFTEKMVTCVCIYCALIYAIFYLYFEAYALIFQAQYALAPGPASLTFLPIAIGSLLSFPVFLTYDSCLARAQRRHKPWTTRYEARRLPLAFIGGPLISASMFWLSWTAQPAAGIPPVVPALSGILYGIGFVLVFMALLNYLTDAYEIYAASALAATSCSRSIVGAVLPLAAGAMYDRLGVQWATSLLALASVACIAIPVAFWIYGERLRAGSKFAGEVKRRREEKEKIEGHVADVEAGNSITPAVAAASITAPMVDAEEVKEMESGKEV
jgi:MFS family permease